MAAPASEAVGKALIRVVSGVAQGREVALTKRVTTIGKPGVQVAEIVRGSEGFKFAYLEGATRPIINGVLLTNASVPLRNGDEIDMAGTKFQFVLY